MEHADRVVVHDLDIRDFRWEGEPPALEILFVDLAKEEDLFRAVADSFYGSFIPGRSLVVHQDFGRPRLSWLHYSTMFLLPWLEILDVIDDTLVLRVERQPERDVLNQLVSSSFDVRAKAHLVQEAARHFGGIRTHGVDYREILGLSEAYVWLRGGDPAGALACLRGLAPTPEFERAFGDMLAEVRRVTAGYHGSCRQRGGG
jgi:hypothetical protein